MTTIALQWPDGPYYPNVGKKFHTIAGQEVEMEAIYLPLVEAGSLVDVSMTQETVISFPSRSSTGVS